ncbi:hypothetical protein FG386_000324 [Cryptosporidium ryanae]|uniref:uncharacterized protein n=1 Tax=Cryptosporidium ryanae TaxID=515981 RepID=UPI00351A0577|nr:hypothetical protein FG386_000324 [Cryptosporidium ryanae]
MEENPGDRKRVTLVDNQVKVASRAKMRLIYDIFSVCYFTTIWMMMFLDCGPNYFSFFYYLTNWGWTSTLLFYIVATLVDFERYTKVNVSFPLIYMCTFLRELSVSLQSVIVPFFWIIVYPKEKWRSITWEVQMHGMGLVFICIDYLIRVSNFSTLTTGNLFSVVFSYLILNYVVVNKLETMIYPGITYNTLESWLVVGLAMALVLIAHRIAVIFTMCISLKDKIWRKYKDDHFLKKSLRTIKKAQELRKTHGVRRRLGSIFVG